MISDLSHTKQGPVAKMTAKVAKKDDLAVVCRKMS